MLKMILWVGSMLLVVGIRAQQPGDSLTKNKIQVDYAERGILQKLEGGDIQKLLGAVELRHDSVYMYCDSAIIQNNTVVAGGNVIVQDDTLVLFADFMHYDGNRRFVKLRDSVILQTESKRLYTHTLSYDLHTKIATYLSGGLLVDNELELSSLNASYYVTEKKAYFRNEVFVRHPDFELRSDSIEYFGDLEEVRFKGPTEFVFDQSTINCHSGYYMLDTDEALFSGGASYIRGGQSGSAKQIFYDKNLGRILLVGDAESIEKNRVARADTIEYFEKSGDIVLKGNAYFANDQRELRSDRIYYDGQAKAVRAVGQSFVVEGSNVLRADSLDYVDHTGESIAVGHVLWRDTAQNVQILADRLTYQRSEQMVKAYGATRPLMIRDFEGDSIFIAADTLYSYLVIHTDSVRSLVDTNRIILAYADVKIYSEDFQIKCDSLSYNSIDSSFYFYQGPRIWYDTTQLYADTIVARMRGNKMEAVHFYKNAFILNTLDGIHYNQIKGSKIFAKFERGKLSEVTVKGNAESYYYVRDDVGAYIGLNRAVCSGMVLDFAGRNKISVIHFFNKPTFVFTPMDKVLANPPKLKGFVWKEEGRSKFGFDVLNSSRGPNNNAFGDQADPGLDIISPLDKKK